MRWQCFAWAGVTLALLAITAAHAEPRCGVPADLLEGDGELPALRDAVAHQRPIKIVVLGGAATAGSGASHPSASYPMRLGEYLRFRLEHQDIQIINKAAPRELAAQMLARLKSEILPMKPTLVIWQTGTVDAVRGVGVDSFARTLSDGLRRLRADAIDVILVDPQYSPRTQGLINIPPFLETIHMLGESADVDVFKRFAIMRLWDETSRFDLSGKPPALTHEIDAIYDCLGGLLADMMIDRLQRSGLPIR